MSAIEAVICDWGGVLTSPLVESFRAFQEASGMPLEALGRAMAASAEREGAHPLFELETGRLSEREFLAGLERGLRAELGREVDMSGFADSYFAGLRPNEDMIDYARRLRERGIRMAILTNNVREWDSRWRAMLPVDDIFELVVDSAHVGMRKPEPGIYELVLERLALPAGSALLVDDIEANCVAARELGISAVWFRDTEQAIAEVDAALGD